MYEKKEDDIIWIGNSKQYMELKIFWDFAKKLKLRSVYQIPDDFLLVGTDFWLSKRECDDDFEQNLFDCWRYNEYPHKSNYKNNNFIAYFSTEELSLINAELGLNHNAANTDFLT